MLRTATTRIVSTAILSSALLVGAANVPAFATPDDNAVQLASMKSAWGSMAPKTHRDICYAYRVAPTKVISQAAARAAKDPTAKPQLTRPAWKSVISTYLAWACSGPGTTPR